jgi:o-succinylbenzoate synthase
MRVDAVALRNLTMRLKTPFETSFGVTQERKILLVEVSSDGLHGWGEVTAPEGPFYNPETNLTSWHILRDFAIPLILGKTVSSPSEVGELVAPIRGHEMAKAGLENALWDIEAQRQGVSLASLLGGTLAEIGCGVSIGIQESPQQLDEKVAEEVAAGYQRVKIKIKPGKDFEFASAIRQRHPALKLMVDANSAYRLEQADYLRKFDALNLMMMEQPLAWDDIYQHARLQAQLKTPICLDECIHNFHHALAAIELGACRIINIKLGRVGGHSQARQIQDLCRQRSIPVWCGGMLESGIGRAHNIAMSALPGFVLPGDVSASRRYWDEDIIDPEVEVTSRGTIAVPTTPGLGYAVRTKRIEQLTTREEKWRSGKS